MGWFKRRKLRRHIKALDLRLYRRNYGATGEYEALSWLKADVEGRTYAEPMHLVRSILNGSVIINQHQKDYLSTLLQWC